MEGTGRLFCTFIVLIDLFSFIVVRVNCLNDHFLKFFLDTIFSNPFLMIKLKKTFSLDPRSSVSDLRMNQSFKVHLFV